MNENGLHVGSTWAEICKIYPTAKITVEGVIAFHAPDNRVSCLFNTKAYPNVKWMKVGKGQENPPNDLKISSLYTVMQ